MHRAADDCLFEYSLRNPASRLTTRSELPPRTTRRDNILVRVELRGCPEATYRAVDGERVHLSTEAQRSFEKMYDSFVADLYDSNVDWQAIGDGAGAFPPGLCSGEEGTAPLVFQEVPYTFEEVELLSCIVPMDQEMFGRFSVLDLFKSNCSEAKVEAITELLNKPYNERFRQFPTAKHPRLEKIDVGHSYNPRLLDFYFAGLRSLSPVVEFKSYYNIIEYYFDDGDYAKAPKEHEQIRQVIRDFVSLERLRSFFDEEIPPPSRYHFENFDGMINGGEIQKIRTSNAGLQSLVAKRIYSYRNSIFHSKRVYRGEPTVVIRPCSKEETQIVAHEVLLTKMVAQEIIKQSRRSE
jgi:hypothetical protein